MNDVDYRHFSETFMPHQKPSLTGAMSMKEMLRRKGFKSIPFPIPKGLGKDYVRIDDFCIIQYYDEDHASNVTSIEMLMVKTK